MSTETQCSWCEVESGNLRPGSHGICERHRNVMLANYVVSEAKYCSECTRAVGSEITWPSENDGQPICQDCWEAQCSRSWWRMVNGINEGIEAYRVNTPNDDLNEPLTLPGSQGKRRASFAFSLRVALACAFLGAILWAGWILGCVIAFLTKGQ